MTTREPFWHSISHFTLQTPVSNHLTPLNLLPTEYFLIPEDTRIPLQDAQNMASCDRAPLSTHKDPTGHLKRIDPLINPYQDFISFFNVDIAEYNFFILVALQADKLTNKLGLSSAKLRKSFAEQNYDQAFLSSA